MELKSKDKDCIYFEGNRGLATVGRGQWYNMMLFMHVMQRERGGKKEAPLDNNKVEERVF